MLARLAASIDHFMPKQSRTPQDALQRRVLIGASGVGLAVAILSLLSALALFSLQSAIPIALFGAGCLGLIAGASRGVSIRVLRRASVALLGVFFTVASLQTVVLDYGAFKWFAYLPVLSLFLSDSESRESMGALRSRALWSGAGLAVALGFAILILNHLGITGGLNAPDKLVYGLALGPFIDFALFIAGFAGLLAVHDFALQKLEEEVAMLRSILAICAWCRRIRDAEEGWIVLERYMTKHTETELTHGICPDCDKRQRAQMS